MKHRNILDNVAIIKLLESVDELETVYQLYVDFIKAFDTLSHTFTKIMLDNFGFGNNFIFAIKTLQKFANSSILINGKDLRSLKSRQE